MRAAVLHLAFEGLGAQYATSGAFADNHASLAVSRKLGYSGDGIERYVRRGTAVTSLRLRLDRETWQRTRSVPVTITGLEQCLPMFGLGPGAIAESSEPGWAGGSCWNRKLTHSPARIALEAEDPADTAGDPVDRQVGWAGSTSGRGVGQRVAGSRLRHARAHRHGRAEPMVLMAFDPAAGKRTQSTHWPRPVRSEHALADGIWLVIGVQAAGKSTVADLLAREFDRAFMSGAASSIAGRYGAGCTPAILARARRDGCSTCATGCPPRLRTSMRRLLRRRAGQHLRRRRGPLAALAEGRPGTWWYSGHRLRWYGSGTPNGGRRRARSRTVPASSRSSNLTGTSRRRPGSGSGSIPHRSPPRRLSRRS